MSVFLERIVDALAKASGLPAGEIRPAVGVPPDPEMGVFAFPCFPLAKALRKAPPAIAADLAGKIDLGEGIEAVAAGPYVNFRIATPTLASGILPVVRSAGEGYGRSEDGAGRTVCLDYSHPNIAKPFGIGHLRSTVIGSSLRRIFEALGWKTVSINHLGDWGTQFGLMIHAFRQWGDEEELARDPVEYLYRLYIRVNEAAKEDEEVAEAGRAAFRELEEGQPEARELWRRFRELSLAEFERLYRRLDVSFDSDTGESFFDERTQAALEELLAAGLTHDSDGALKVEIEGLPEFTVRKSDGTTLYLTRDLAAAKYRQEEYRFDLLVYVVGAPQKLHFQQLFATLAALGYDWAERCEHVEFGHILGMKTREGNLIFLEEVLNEARDRSLTKMREGVEKRFELDDEEGVAEQIGISAVVFNDLSNRRIKDVTFDWDRIITFEGDSGPYLQYAHARIEGILRKSGVEVPETCDPSLLVEPEAATLLRLLDRYPGVIRDAGRQREPSVIARYLLDLAHALSVAYTVLRVKDQERPLAEARLLLLWSVKQVLASGLRLLGIRPVERM